MHTYLRVSSIYIGNYWTSEEGTTSFPFLFSEMDLVQDVTERLEEMVSFMEQIRTRDSLSLSHHIS